MHFDENLRPEPEQLDYVRVSEHSRRVAHTAPDKLIEQLKQEKATLISEKLDIERQLSEIDDQQTVALDDILSQRLANHISYSKTASLKVRTNEKRLPLKRRLYEIQNRCAEIKKQISGAPPTSDDPWKKRDAVQLKILRTLERIEALLVKRPESV